MVGRLVVYGEGGDLVGYLVVLVELAFEFVRKKGYRSQVTVFV